MLPAPATLHPFISSSHLYRFTFYHSILDSHTHKHWFFFFFAPYLASLIRRVPRALSSHDCSIFISSLFHALLLFPPFAQIRCDSPISALAVNPPTSTKANSDSFPKCCVFPMLLLFYSPLIFFSVLFTASISRLFIYTGIFFVLKF